jgi:hypothetical protein
MNGIKDSPANGYLQVKRAMVAGNTIIDCKHSILIGYADEDVQALMPPECAFEENFVAGRGGKLIDIVAPAAKLVWRGNLLTGGEAGVPLNDGISIVKPDAARPQSRGSMVQRSKVGVAWKVSPAR